MFLLRNALRNSALPCGLRTFSILRRFLAETSPDEAVASSANPKPNHFAAPSAFPTVPIGWDPIDESLLPPVTRIDAETISLLERQSLVDFGNERGVRTLEAAVRFADQLSLVDTSDTKPLTTVLENETLALRDDEVTCGGEEARLQALVNASVVYEDFFVAPPGNIALEPRDYEFARKEGGSGTSKLERGRVIEVSVEKT